MAVLEEFDPEHPLYDLFRKVVTLQPGSVRARYRGRGNYFQAMLRVFLTWQNVFRAIHRSWQNLPIEQQQWWQENKPPAAKSGYNYFLSVGLLNAANLGEFTIGESEIGSGAYIAPSFGGEGPQARWTVGFSFVGGNAAIS